MNYFFNSDPDILIEKKIKDIKKGKDDSKENFDFSDVEKNSQDGFPMGAAAPLPKTPSFESDLNYVDVGNAVPALKEVVSLDKLEISSSDGALTVEKDNEISSCVVCDKKFKSKSCMNKHLRSVHAGMFSLLI